jgi:hypothetical protein
VKKAGTKWDPITLHQMAAMIEWVASGMEGPPPWAEFTIITPACDPERVARQLIDAAWFLLDAESPQTPDLSRAAAECIVALRRATQ